MSSGEFWDALMVAAVKSSYQEGKDERTEDNKGNPFALVTKTESLANKITILQRGRLYDYNGK